MTAEQLITLTLNFYGFLYVVAAFYVANDMKHLEEWVRVAEPHWEAGTCPPMPNARQMQADANCEFVSRYLLLRPLLDLGLFINSVRALVRTQ